MGLVVWVVVIVVSVLTIDVGAVLIFLQLGKCERASVQEPSCETQKYEPTIFIPGDTTRLTVIQCLRLSPPLAYSVTPSERFDVELKEDSKHYMRWQHTDLRVTDRQSTSRNLETASQLTGSLVATKRPAFSGLS